MEYNKLQAQFIDEIKQIVQQARKQAYSAINSAMVEAYWKLGKRIVEEEQQGQGSEKAAVQTVHECVSRSDKRPHLSLPRRVH